MTRSTTGASSPAVAALVRAGVPRDVATAARDAAMAKKIPLARLVAVAEAETGFRNVWGHDAGKWRESGPLTPQSVARYFAQPPGRRPNGAGVWQLTWGPFQEDAQRRGGLHNIRVQATVAARVVAGLPSAGGTAAGIARYNGSGPAARAYGVRVHAREAHWQRVIHGEG